MRVLVIAHTHWDREWYHTAGRFRQRLVALIDELLDDLPAEGESFLLDGQAIVLTDYLAVRPERAAELSEALRSGRIEAGPWYVLADELIPSGEALVRNLLAGRDALRRLRASPPPVLYCPDAFGHPAALPILANGFGCEVVVVWRGYGGMRWPESDTVRWRACGDAEALLYHLSRDGYEFGKSLPTNPHSARERWLRIEQELRPRSPLGVALLLNGADHHARQHEQSAAVRALARAAEPSLVIATTLREAGQTLAAAARDKPLPEVRGELRDSYGYTWTLQGTLASRAAQKRANARLERTLVRDVEPWVALAPAGGSTSDRALLDVAWRSLLEGHPHDTLCGTAIDAVADALDARHADVGDQATGLRDLALASLLEYDAERARRAQPSWKPVVVVRNRVAYSRGGVVELSLAATVADVAVGPGSAERQGARREVPAWRVNGVPLQILSTDERVVLTESARDYPDADLVARAQAVGWIPPMPGYGITTIEQTAARSRSRTDVPNRVRVARRVLENGLLRVEVGEHGVVQLTTLATGRVVEHVVSFDDIEDLGDLYTPSLRRPLPALVAHRVRVVHRGPIRGEIAIDFRSKSDRKDSSRCTVSLTLDADQPILRLRVDGDNHRRDHRLRLRIATGIGASATVADAPFHPVSREPLTISREDAKMESVVPTAPLHRWVSRFTADSGATIFSDGLAEYESLPDGAVAITLVRSVGQLSRHDLPERPGHAGWPADTPAAQSIGPFHAAFALALHGPDSPEQREELERMADDMLLPLRGRTLRSNVDDPRTSGGLELVGLGLVFSAAMPAREQGWIVLRCVNRRDHAVDGAWRLERTVREARLARLDETLLAALEHGAHVIPFVAPPLGVVTILARTN